MLRIHKEMVLDPQFRQLFEDPFTLRFMVPRRAIRILLLSLHLIKLLALIDALSAGRQQFLQLVAFFGY